MPASAGVDVEEAEFSVWLSPEELFECELLAEELSAALLMEELFVDVLSAEELLCVLLSEELLSELPLDELLLSEEGSAAGTELLSVFSIGSDVLSGAVSSAVIVISGMAVFAMVSSVVSVVASSEICGSMTSVAATIFPLVSSKQAANSGTIVFLITLWSFHAVNI